MFERFEPAERVFVNREEHLAWMADALGRCQDQSVVLHLRGIGGIGKTTLLEHWDRTVEASIFMDCSRVTEFFDRLDMLAKGAARLGIKLRRFDLLWSIRLRFVKGVEPVKEPGRSWAFDVIKPLPFIGNLVSISKAIRAVGMKLSPRLKKRFGDVATWLRKSLGKNFMEKLLEMLWKDPHLAEALYLDALLEDLSARKQKQPLLVLLDHFEQVDSEQLRWRYSGRKVSEHELWYVFLSSLSNSVGVTASRRELSTRLGEEVTVEEAELTELDVPSCHDLLSERGITEKELQSRIVSVSGGNPFVLSTICDIAEIGELSVEEMESLRAETLEEVRLKTWRRLFSRAEGLHEIIDYAGLLPHFTRDSLTLLVPHLKTDHWKRLIHLSFVRHREDGTWDLHDLARELVLAELGDRLPKLALVTASTLEGAAKERADAALQGIALSVQALVDEPEAIDKIIPVFFELRNSSAGAPAALTLLASVRFATNPGRATLHWLKGVALGLRYSEAQQEFQEAVRLFRSLAAEHPDKYLLYLVSVLTNFASLHRNMSRTTEADTLLQEALPILEDLRQQGERPFLGSPDIHLELLASAQTGYALNLMFQGRFTEAETAMQKALTLRREYAQKDPRSILLLVSILPMQSILYLFSGRPSKGEECIQEALGIIRGKEKELGFWWFYSAGWVHHFYTLILLFTSRLVEAEMVIRKAVEYLQEYVKQRKGGPESQQHLARSINLLCVVLRHLGQFGEAEETIQEAITIYRGISEAEEWGSIPLSATLSNFAGLLRQTGRLGEAEKTYKEAMTHHRLFKDLIEGLFRCSVVSCYNNYSLLLRQTNRLAEAEALLREALQIIQSFASKQDFIDMYQALLLNNLGVALAQANKQEEGEAVFREVLMIRRRLAAKTPSMYVWMLVSTLNNMGVWYQQRGQLAEAQQHYEEALEYHDALIANESKIYQSYIIPPLCNLALLLEATGAPSKTVKKLRAQLEALGVTTLPETVTWSEDELDDWASS
ncbi:MAG: tetratricopeptide repeat protein [Promethearchaeota archaeon]